MFAVLALNRKKKRQKKERNRQDKTVDETKEY